MKSRALLLCFLLLLNTSVRAQSATPPCPVQEQPEQALYGQWDARIDGQPGIATVRLAKHPDYDGVRGTVERASQPPAQLAGDIDEEGQLRLDESRDGRTISAIWIGQWVPGHCGKRLQGTWRNTDDKNDDEDEHVFVLDKAQGWQ